MRDRLLLLLLVLLVFAGSLVLASTFPLIDPDEGRNAEVAREMLAARDWVIPRLAGMPYLDKPPLLFWAEALSFKAFGVTPFAARVPAAVAAALTLWMLGAFGLRHAGRWRAFASVALLAGAPLFAVLSAYVIFDMLLAACVTVVWLAVARETLAHERGEPRPPSRIPVVHIALALGVLIKGPVMLAWAIGGSLGAALLCRSRAPLHWMARVWGWALFFAIAGGWFALALERHPEYLRYAFFDETFRRMATGAFHREQPWWFVPAVLAGGALPWSLATPWGRGAGTVSRAALGFVLLAAVFFTLSRSKLVTYLVPVLPMLAWVAAEAWADARRARRGGIVLGAVLAAIGAGGLAFASVPRLVAVTGDPGGIVSAAVRNLGLAVLILAVLAFASAWRRRPAWGVCAAALFTPAVLLAAGPAGAMLAARTSGADLAAAIEAHDPTARVRYEYAYSPGTDFLLGRGGWFVSETGHEFTSNYQVLYRDELIGRGLWVPASMPEAAPPADVIVRQVRDTRPVPPGWSEFHRDLRFVAYRPESDSR